MLKRERLPVVLELDQETTVKLEIPQDLESDEFINATEYEGGLAL